MPVSRYERSVVSGSQGDEVIVAGVVRPDRGIAGRVVRMRRRGGQPRLGSDRVERIVPVRFVPLVSE